jgi:hypothetical protein
MSELLNESEQIAQLKGVGQKVSVIRNLQSTIVINLGDIPVLHVESFDGEITCATGRFDVWRCDECGKRQLAETHLSDAQVIGKIMAHAPFPGRNQFVVGSIVHNDYEEDEEQQRVKIDPGSIAVRITLACISEDTDALNGLVSQVLPQDLTRSHTRLVGQVIVNLGLVATALALNATDGELTLRNALSSIWPSAHRKVVKLSSSKKIK